MPLTRWSPWSRSTGALVASLALLAGAHAADVPTRMEHTATAPVIDGRLEDACWTTAVAVAIDHGNSKDEPRAETTPATVRYAWDQNYLYIGYETFDRNLVALPSGERQGPRDNQRDGCQIWLESERVDVVEFFISLGETRCFWELHHNAANQFNDVWCLVTDPSWPIHQAAMNPYGIIFHQQEFLEDDGACTLATATTLKPKADGSPSTIGGDDVDTGYRGELRIPWRTLGAPRDRHVKDAPGTWNIDGLEVAVIAVVQDGDRAQRYYRSGPYGVSGWFHHDQAVWPRYALASIDGAATPTPKP